MGDVWIATNASVNSLASFHAVTYGATGCLFGQLVQYSFHTVRGAQPKTS